MIVDQLEPPSVDLSILYPVIAEPPLSTGVIHDRLICDDEDVAYCELVPTELIEDTLYEYVVLDCNPVSEYVVELLPVLDCIVDQVVPVSVDLSILYPVIAEPPLSIGVIHDRLICDEDIVVADSPVGAAGEVIGVLVVADAVLDGELVPAELIAETLYE